ncbi:hypothetical protein SEA_DANFORTH_89 [Mycobacterium phage Danforth]|nr:hypothetical protein SEA_DANFORTH_89 [Mycobacterium phage Danforth]
MAIRVLKRYDVDKLTALKEIYDHFRDVRADRLLFVDDWYSKEHDHSEWAEYDDEINEWNADLMSAGIALAGALAEAMGWDR